MKTVLLDIDDTIFDFHCCAVASIKKSAIELNVELSDKMIERYFEQNWELWGEYEKGIIERDDIFKTRFPLLFEEFKIKADGLAFEDAFQKYFMTECEPVIGAKDFVEYLNSRYDLYIVSNSMELTQKSRLKKSGLDKYFKEVFVSDKVGHQKPTKEFFDYCFSRIENFNQKETIIIGDSLSSDIQGGINAGIKTCWFNPKKKQNNLNLHCDYEIHSLEEIKNIL